MSARMQHPRRASGRHRLLSVGSGGRGGRRRWPIPAVALAAAVLLGQAGCSLGRATIALAPDYGAYRRFQTSETLEQRLSWGWRYVRDHEDGVYHPQVRAWFDRAEPVYWEVQSGGRAGLEGYLRTLPDGPHADEALERLMDLRLAERVRVARRTGATEALARIDEERGERERVAGLPLEWVRLLLDPAVWRGPLDEAPGPLLARWSYERPRPICFWDEFAELHRCTKTMSPSYPVVVDGELERRVLLLNVELELDRSWRLRTARIFGPRIFQRAAESLTRRPVEDGNRGAIAGPFEALQQGAIVRADEVGLGCDEHTNAGRWGLLCDGLGVVVQRAEGDEDDLILVAP